MGWIRWANDVAVLFSARRAGLFFCGAVILLRMTLLIGIDEAGYGPNLGPLVVGATAWRDSGVGGQRSGDLYGRLAGFVSLKPADGWLAIADSKVLYKPGGGLRQLERGVLTARAVVDGKATTRWQELFEAADTAGHRHELPWYADYDCPLPVNATAEEIAELQTRFSDGCEAAGVRLLDMRARVVFPREFNDLTDRYGTKGAALSHISIGLLKDLLDRASTSGPTYIVFDKHGGRNRYAALLEHHFPDQPIEMLDESRAASHYQWGPPASRVHVTFRTRGEEELPTALASMTAKYHRELAMRAFNAYWAVKVDGLRPTAGYPLDAKRFKAEIGAKQQELEIEDRDLWRNR